MRSKLCPKYCWSLFPDIRVANCVYYQCVLGSALNSCAAEIHVYDAQFLSMTKIFLKRFNNVEKLCSNASKNEKKLNCISCSLTFRITCP